MQVLMSSITFLEFAPIFTFCQDVPDISIIYYGITSCHSTALDIKKGLLCEE